MLNHIHMEATENKTEAEEATENKMEADVG
jgi:hypothetical protein